MSRYLDELWRSYIKYRADVYRVYAPDCVDSCIVSETNWLERGRSGCGEDVGIHVVPGDICYMDFGQQYLNEAGFQHFGLVLSLFSRKALVVPMTSNPATYAKAYDPVDNPGGRKHLMRIGRVEGLFKPSVLFLNDMKYVNTARVIDVKAHIPTDSPMFQTVKKRILSILFSGEDGHGNMMLE